MIKIYNMLKSGIYRMYWDNNNYFYYGQALRLAHRKSCHKETMLKGKHKNPKIQAIFNKYGLPKFEVIERCNPDLLDDIEQYYLDIYHGNKYCCNINKLATSSKGIKQSAESIEKNRVSHLFIFDGENNPFYGKKHSEKTKSILSGQKKGLPIKHWIGINIGKKASPETRKKLSDIKKYGGAPKAKLVLDINTGIFYSCAKEVSDLYNISHSSLRAKLNGARYNNTTWIYA